MFQTIQGIDVFVVELVDFPPPLPITDGNSPELSPYAKALQSAIQDGIVRGPGKYGINVTSSLNRYNIFRIDD